MSRRLRARRLAAASIVVASVVVSGCADSEDRPSLNEQAPPPTTVPSVVPVGTETPTNLVPEDGYVAVEDFGQSGALEQVVTRLAWSTPLGAWAISDGTVGLVGPLGLAPGIAFTRLGASDGLVQVRMPQVVNGAGLLFRYADAQNYWAITAVPSFVTWNVTKVVEGRPSIVANLGLAATEADTTVGVILEGDQIVVLIDGRQMATIVDDDLITAEAAGLFASGPGVEAARWDDLVVIAVEAGIAPPPPFSLPTPSPSVEPVTTPAEGTTAGPTPTPTPFGSAALAPTPTPTPFPAGGASPSPTPG